MRKTLVLVTFAVGCGTTSDTIDPTATTTPAPPPAQPRLDADSFGLHDTPGPIAGLPGFTFTRTLDATHCGGIALAVTRDSNVAIAPGDQPLVDVLAMTFPTDLDFSDGHREQARTTFDHWLTDTSQRAEAAVAAFTQQSSQATDPTVKVEANARVVQTLRYFAGLLLRAQMPIDVRTGDNADDKRDAFCDAVATAADPLLEKASKVALVCANAGKTAQSGWWTSVCVP